MDRTLFHDKGEEKIWSFQSTQRVSEYSRLNLREVLSELNQGSSVNDLARKYSISVTNILNWRKSTQLAMFTRRVSAAASEQASVLQDMVPVSEYQRVIEENKNLKRSLVNMTVDRDILRDAVDIASKKKWL